MPQFLALQGFSGSNCFLLNNLPRHRSPRLYRAQIKALSTCASGAALERLTPIEH